MPHKEWSDSYSKVVREAAPEVPPFDANDRSALWEQIQTAAAVSAPRRRRWRVAIAGAAAACMVGVAGVATAGVFSAHTGKGPSDAEDLGLGGPGEKLNPAAPDFAAVFDQVTGDIRFPTVDARKRAMAWETESLVTGDALVSTGALRLWMAGHAVCSWTNTWAVALHTGDGAAERQAAGVILGAHTWTSITDTAPYIPASELDYLGGVERAVRSSDAPAAKNALVNSGACAPGLAPELGIAPW
ncbi:MAG: hypothetical protein QM714_06700 [Nocardioides sp.]|uniref:hypothetical protein n=1 Tax=Nocardioides sp. TaxID=35761 RepID=UPI0039E62E58